MNRIRSALPWFCMLVVGILGTWMFHLPQFASNFDKFPGDRGDARLVAYLMEHWHQVFQGIANWRSPAMFYPVEGTIGYADLMLGYGIVFSVFRTLGLGIFESAEFTIILFNFLNYLVCFVLLNKVLRLNWLASIAGAAFFAFSNPKLVQLGHLQLQPIVFLPLFFICVVLLVRKGDTLTQAKAFGLIALASISLDLQLLTGFYPGWFIIFWSALFLVFTLLFERTRSVVVEQLRKFWRPLLGGVAVFAAGLIPFALAYLPIMRSVGGRPYDEIRSLIPVTWSLLLMSQRNHIWGKLSAAIQAAHPTSPELQIGIGLVPTLAWLGLLAFAVWFIIKNARDEEGVDVRRTNLLFLSQLILATTLFYLLGTRYWHDFSPWQFVYSFVPGAQAIRAVARYALVLALPMSIGFAYAIHSVFSKISAQPATARRAILLLLLFGVVAFGLAEQTAGKEGFDGFSIKAENEYLNRMAQALPNGCSSFYVTVKPAALHNQFEYHIDAAFVSIMTRVPTLNGYSGQLPQNWNLWDMMGPGYETNVKSWIAQQHLNGNVCRLAIPETTAREDIADPEVFIRQQYLDILQRPPDPAGLQTWLTKLSTCPRQGGRASDKKCDREYVSLQILNSTEFVERSDFVLRLYLAVLGRPPLHKEFVADREPLVTAETAQLASAKQALVSELVQRPEFKAKYDSLNNATFVDELAQNSIADRTELVEALDAQQKTRAQVVKTIVDDPHTVSAFRNRGLVLMQFFGNLNRDPEPWEYQAYLNSLDVTGDYRQLITNFIYSAEYRKRFGYVN